MSVQSPSRRLPVAVLAEQIGGVEALDAVAAAGVAAVAADGAGPVEPNAPKPVWCDAAAPAAVEFVEHGLPWV